MKLSLIPLTLSIPILILGLSVWLIASPWFIRFEYKRLYGTAISTEFSLKETERLGLIGLSSILPSGPGIAVLKDAKLPSGDAAFSQKERAHMADVQSAFESFLYWAYSFPCYGLILQSLTFLCRRGS